MMWVIEVFECPALDNVSLAIVSSNGRMESISSKCQRIGIPDLLILGQFLGHILLTG